VDDGAESEDGEDDTLATPLALAIDVNEADAPATDTAAP
jgi:exoribonuclease-2